MGGKADTRRSLLGGTFPSERDKGRDGADGERRTQVGPELVQSGFVWAFIGGLGTMVGVDIACVLMAYGMGLALADGRGGRRTAFVVACLGCVLACVLGDLSRMPYALLGCLLARGVSADGTGLEVSVGKKCLMALAGAAGLVAIGIGLAWAYGTTFTQIISQTIEGYNDVAEQLSSAQARASIAAAQQVARTYWPLGFLLSALLELVCGRVGAILAARKRGVRTSRTLADYDAPLWVCVVFALGVAASLGSSLVPTYAPQVKMVGENVLSAARIALALQGLALVSYLSRRFNFGPISKGLLLFVAFYLEISYIVMSALGLIDILAANFRGLPRTRGRKTGSGAQSESA